MLHALHRLPDLAILAVVVLFVAGCGALAPSIGARLLKLGENQERDDAAFDAFKGVMSMTGVVLAFSLVQATSNLKSIENNVASLAGSISAADRVLLRMGRPDFVQLRPVLHAFGDTVVNDEWALLGDEERSDKADQLYGRLSSAARALEPKTPREQSMYGELLKALDDISDHREHIIEESDTALPDFFWITVGGLLLIAFALALFTHATLPRRAGIAATSGAVALLLAFVIIIDIPFEGETSVSARPLESAIAVAERRS